MFAAVVSTSYHNEDSNLTPLANERNFRTPASQEVGVLLRSFFFFVRESNMLSAKRWTLGLKQIKVWCYSNLSHEHL